jgi:hypothetical protein
MSGEYGHIITLLSFVYALALTHLLTRVGGLLMARARVRFSGLLTLAIVNSVYAVFSNWLVLWNMHVIGRWNLADIASEFCFAAIMYVQCIVCTPDPDKDGPIDMEAFYWAQHRLFYGANATAKLLALFGVLVYAETTGGFGIRDAIGPAIAILPALLGLFAPQRWAQWVAGVGLFLAYCGFTAVYVAGRL